MRPTLEDLAHASGDLEHLAYRDQPHDDPRNRTGFTDLAALLNLFVWQDTELADARKAAAYGPGSEGGYAVIHRGGHSDIDSRTHDAHRRAMLRMRGAWQHKLGQLVDELREEAIGEVGSAGLQSTGT